MSPRKVGYASPKLAISGRIDTVKVRIKNDFIYISFMVGDGGFGGGPGGGLLVMVLVLVLVVQNLLSCLF